VITRTLLVVAFLIPVAALRAQAPPAAPEIPWVRIPAGTFDMGCASLDERCGGDEHPKHSVTISTPFEMMATEVTVGMYRATAAVVDDQPAWSTMPEQPVVIVTWDEAQAFCRAAGGRLPTEAEWEYAARGGKADLVYPWGNEPPTNQEGAVNGAAFESDAAWPVRSFAANGFGLYDMAGNVWEWVADWGGFYSQSSLPATDPTGPDTGRTRVVRGGSYGDDPVNLRVSNRTPNPPDRANLNVGFRCVREAREAS
jgi:formylglycine-generating enzyme required for sulfatase activity